MKIKKVIILFTLIVSATFSYSNNLNKNPDVLFLNPGEPVNRGKGLFWALTADLMGVAAENLGINLEVIYAERDHLLMLRQAKEVSQRKNLPDYIVMVNEKNTAPQMLELFKNKPVKIVLIHNSMNEDQREQFGNERQGFKNWIGSFTTDEESGTYNMMEGLYKQLGDEEPQIIGITGERGTPVSLKRAQGVEDYINEKGRGTHLQLLFSNWSTNDAETKANLLLGRYPQANIIWAANFSMALGALKAVQASGRSVLVGSTAAPPQSLKNLTEGDMAVSMGSHFFIGAWTMVLLYDYHNGIDFIDDGGVLQSLDYLTAINSENASGYYDIVYNDNVTPDFSIFSKKKNPEIMKYNFSLDPLMRK